MLLSLVHSSCSTSSSSALHSRLNTSSSQSLGHPTSYLLPKSSDHSLKKWLHLSSRSSFYGRTRNFTANAIQASLLEAPVLWAGRVFVFYALLRVGLAGSKSNPFVSDLVGERGGRGAAGIAEGGDFGFSKLLQSITGDPDKEASDKRKLVSKCNNLRHVSQSPPPDDANHEMEMQMEPSASAIVAAIQRGSSNTASVEFQQRIEKDQKGKSMLPSPDFHRLCVEQLDLFRRIVHPEAILSVYVRPAGSYVMDQLELRRVVASHPGAESDEVLVLTGNFRIPTGLRAAEAALTRRQIEFVSEPSAVVFPMVKHPFVVGFLVAELPKMEMKASDPVQGDGSCGDLMHLPPSLEDSYASSSGFDKRVVGSESCDDHELHSSIHKFSSDTRLNAINISRSLAMAYVMDQKAMLLQHSSWQTNVRMSSLVEQIRGSLSSIRTLCKMLTVHVKKSEIPYDVVEDILVQGEHIRDTLQELQDAVYMTKANIMRYNEESLKRIISSTNKGPERESCQLPQNLLRDYSSKLRSSTEPSFPLSSGLDDLEMPMPPLSLAPFDTVGIRPCTVSEVLTDMVEAAKPLARMQQRVIELNDLSRPLQVTVEEPALRQGLSNLIEGALLRTQTGGKVEIVSTRAPAGGVLVVIDDDGPDMHYMTQMHSLTPFGADLFSEGMVEDNMTWNFIAGLTVAREILESYGCVVRVISPRSMDAAVGSGGTRVELWLPSLPETPN